MKNFIISIALLLITSCTSDGKLSNALIVDINIPQGDTIPTIVPDSIFEAVKYVKLDNVKEAVIGEIKDIIIQNNHIYILERRRNAILVFDMKGRYINKLDNRGRGRGEYLYLDDYKIKDSNMVVLDRANKRLLYHDLTTFKFIKQLKLDNYYSRFEFLDNNIVLYGDYGFKNNIVVISGLDGRVVEDNLKPVNDEQIGVGFSHNPFFKCDDKIYATFPYEYSVYEIDSSYCKKIINYDFGDKMYSKKLQEASSDTRKQYLKRLDILDYPISSIEKAIVTDRYIISSFVYRFMTYCLIYDRYDSTYKCGLISGSERYPFASQRYSTFYDNKLVYAIDAINIADSSKSKPEELIGVKANDNPVIAIYDLRTNIPTR